jgi:hypothetical protein
MSDILKTETHEDSKKFKNEKERQQMRKSNQHISRFLDNYFNSNLYSKSWWPNGVFRIKK